MKKHLFMIEQGGRREGKENKAGANSRENGEETASRTT
jgi:hypothetical protein